MTEAELRAILANEIHVAPESITDETKGWDSLATMQLVMAVEPLLGRQLEDDVIANLTTWPALKAACGLAAPPAFRKVLILDADGTLWDGVAGEGPITPRADRQERWRALRERGVILCLLSRNTRAAIEEAVNPDDFVSIVTDCGNKADEIRALATALNVDPSACVFVDDSPFEREAVTQMLPTVTVASPDDDLEPLFPVMVDTSKTEQYRALSAAEQTRAQYATEEEFLASLGMVVYLRKNARGDIPRIAELTQKANQFNLTTRRLSEAEVKQAMRDGAVYSISLADRFGDQGLTGIVIMAGHDVQNMILSCRIMGRQVEYAVWPVIMADLNARSITAHYYPTERNGGVVDYWAKLGLVEHNYRGPQGGRFYHGWPKVQVPFIEVHFDG